MLFSFLIGIISLGICLESTDRRSSGKAKLRKDSEPWTYDEEKVSTRSFVLRDIGLSDDEPHCVTVLRAPGASVEMMDCARNTRTEGGLEGDLNSLPSGLT